jgi:hypothetical protein
MTPPAEAAAATIRRDSQLDRELLRVDAGPGREVSRPRVSAGPR